MMNFEEYPFATPLYALSVALRYQILRAPLGLEFTEDDLSKEWQDIHIGAFADNDEICACLVLTPKDDKTIKMRQVAVAEDLQGKGIGTSLVKYAEKVSLKKGFSKIVLSARIPAVDFYERLKYSKVGEQFTEVGIPHYHMEKKL